VRWRDGFVREFVNRRLGDRQEVNADLLLSPDWPEFRKVCLPKTILLSVVELADFRRLVTVKIGFAQEMSDACFGRVSTGLFELSTDACRCANRLYCHMAKCLGQVRTSDKRPCLRVKRELWMFT